MKYKIKHITEYLYADSVSQCYNVAHVTPRATKRQICISNTIHVDPLPAVANTRINYYGNLAYHFEIQQRHNKLVITSDSLVETNNQQLTNELGFGETCAAVREQLQTDMTEDGLLAREFVLDSPIVKATDELREYAAPLFNDNKPFLQAVMELTTKIFTEFEYSPASTTVSTPLADVLKMQKGVCQDFAHLQIGCLRALGFPAQYVSGYIETLPPPGQEKLVGTDATHAWLSVYCPVEGWVEFDPTNNCLANEQHVITAFGRDYSDVTPLKGVIFGGGSPVLSVSVDVARQEEVEAPVC